MKQADTILLSYPLGVNMSETLLSNDLTFYDPITGIPANTRCARYTSTVGWTTRRADSQTYQLGGLIC